MKLKHATRLAVKELFLGLIQINENFLDRIFEIKGFLIFSRSI